MIAMPDKPSLPVSTVLLVSALVPAALGSAGCSNQQVYEAIQQANLQECQNNPEFTREKCERQVSEPYERYEADRQAAVQDSRQ